MARTIIVDAAERWPARNATTASPVEGISRQAIERHAADSSALAEGRKKLEASSPPRPRRNSIPSSRR